MRARSYNSCYTQGRHERSSANIIQGRGREDHRVGRRSMLGWELIRDCLVDSVN